MNTYSTSSLIVGATYLFRFNATVKISTIISPIQISLYLTGISTIIELAYIDQLDVSIPISLVATFVNTTTDTTIGATLASVGSVNTYYTTTDDYNSWNLFQVLN